MPPKRRKKKSYLVEVREVHVQKVRVRATSPEEAKELVAEGDGDLLDNSLEYSHCLEPETWTVEEE